MNGHHVNQLSSVARSVNQYIGMKETKDIGKIIVRHNHVEHVIWFDMSDFDKVTPYNWRVMESFKNFYALRAGGKRGLIILMRRDILSAPHGTYIDHIDGNGLNNRRSNLRFCTKAQNQMNRKCRYGMSKFKGVSTSYNTVNPWRAYIGISKKSIHIRCFATEREAAIAYNDKALELFGEFANLNEV